MRHEENGRAGTSTSWSARRASSSPRAWRPSTTRRCATSSSSPASPRSPRRSRRCIRSRAPRRRTAAADGRLRLDRRGLRRFPRAHVAGSSGIGIRAIGMPGPTSSSAGCGRPSPWLTLIQTARAVAVRLLDVRLHLLEVLLADGEFPARVDDADALHGSRSPPGPWILGFRHQVQPARRVRRAHQQVDPGAVDRRLPAAGVLEVQRDRRDGSTVRSARRRRRDRRAS